MQFSIVDATTGAGLWAQHYDRPLQNIFALQDEIVRSIVTTLKLQLNLRERGLLAVNKQTDNLEAFDDFLRGWAYFWSFTKEGNAKARQMFEKAIELDPSYADAYSSLGQNYLWGWYLQLSPDPNARERSSQLAQHAIALDDSLPNAHILLSDTYLLKGQYEQAIAEAERAIDLDPSSGPAYLALANIMDESRKPADAVGFAEKAMRQDPNERYVYLFNVGWSYTQMKRYAEAIPILKLYLAHYPNNFAARANLIIDYTELGREQEARTEAAELVRTSPNFSIEGLARRSVQADQVYQNRLYADLRKAGVK
jgi:adenylate cyclase